jgi:hypothetical protein
MTRNGMSPEAEDILSALQASAVSIDQLDAPAEPGTYGFFLNEGSSVPGIAQPGGRPIYVGISGNLAQREFDTHFASGQSGFSTLRRSLGALLIDQLQLRPRPRGSGASDTNYRNYRFDDQGENRLSQWMTANLRVGIQPVRSPKEIERQLIALACPPLNLTHWSNPDTPTIKAARRACVDAAREAEHR